MRALIVTANGGPEVLQVQDVPLPSPAPTQLLVSVAAAGVNFIDVYRRQGVYPIPVPFGQGTELAGTVLAVGSLVSGFKVGDRVATASSLFGAQASFALVEQDRAVTVPGGVELDVAAAAMLQGMTAHYLVTSTFVLSAGQEVLIHAAAGGVGQLLVQLAKNAGAHVIATAGTSAKAEIARAAGADEVFHYEHLDTAALVQAIRSASDGGANVVYDGVGKSTFECSLGSLRRRGMIVLYGGASGQVPPFDLQRLNAGGSLFVTRPKLDDYTADVDELRWRASELFNLIASGALRIAIGGRYPLDQAVDAYRDLESRRTTGKLLIVN